MDTRPHRSLGSRRGRERNCSVGRTLEILSSAWTFLVIREAFFGIRRFQDFHTELNISRGVLADRLEWLTSHGIFARTEYQASPKRFEYRLTQKGLGLYPSFIALMKWGDRWLWRGKPPPLALYHKACRRWIDPLTVCSHCGEVIAPEAVVYRDGPGAGSTSIWERRRVRRVSDPEAFLRGRRCSVARTLKIIGDRWSFLVIREAFFAVRRYDDFCRNLRISTNVLADRLQWMVAEGIFFRSPYQSHREQLEYRFTEKGKQLYASMITMMRWGDKWLSPAGPPLLLHHCSCGHDFHAAVVCDCCGKELKAREMAYESRDVRATTPSEAPTPGLQESAVK
jgi:DNA-binding HxlR family transcriptional regulator